jgi:hypothetical protein
MIRVLLFLFFAAQVLAYTPPPGCPDPAPSFGWEIDRATPAWPANWTAGTPTAAANCYYIDNTFPGASDASNGHPGAPRLTIPYLGNNSQAAGTFIYIHAGTYALGTISLSSQGTTGAPIWFTGNPNIKPIISSGILHVGDFSGAAFWVIENLSFTNAAAIDVRPTGSGSQVDNVLIRNLTMRGTGSGTDGNGIALGGGTTSAEQTSYVVVYNCDIQNYGLGSDPTSETACVYNNFNGDHFFTYNNILKKPGADCVAGSHNANDSNRKLEYVFIAGNEIESGGENCIDLKCLRYFMIAHNHCYGETLRENGWCMSIHSGSDPLPCRDGWIFHNTIHGMPGGIYLTATYDIRVFGNVIYDIKKSYEVQAEPLNGYAIGWWGVDGAANITADNTVYDCDHGFYFSGLDADDLVKVHGNIMNSRANPAGYDFNIDNGDEVYFTLDYNFWPSSARIRYMNNIWTLAQLQSNTAMEDHGLSGNPLFVSAGTADFSLQSGSPARDASVEGPVGGTVYDAFNTAWSLPVEVDITGGSRPTDGFWEMGAIEYGSVYTPPTELPTLSSATIPSSGTTIELAFSEAVTPGSGGSVGWALSLSTGSVTASYASGSGTSTLTYNLSGTVNNGISGTVSYTQPGNGIEDAFGNDLATLSGFAITNNSSQSFSAIPRLRDKAAIMRSILMSR